MGNIQKYYIDVEALVEYLYYEVNAIDGRTGRIIREFPKEDVIEVVRCKECVFNEDRGKNQFYQWCCQNNKYHPSD